MSSNHYARVINCYLQRPIATNCYIKVASRFIPVETVDEGWSGESLSDDEVDLPKDHLSNAAMEDLEEEEDDDGFLPSREIDSFNDLGLDRFVANLETEAVSPSSSSAFAGRRALLRKYKKTFA